MKRYPEQQQARTLVKDDEIQGNERRNEGIQDNIRRKIESKHCNTDLKGINQIVQPDIHDKESKWEMEKNTGYECVKLGDRRHPLQDSRFERGQSNNLTWRLEHLIGPLHCISPHNRPNKIIIIPSIRVPEQPLYIQNNAIWNNTLTNILHNSNGTNNATNKNENRDQNNQLRRRYLFPSPEQGIREEYDSDNNRYSEIFRFHNEYRKELDRTETNSNFSRMGIESSKCNS
ncbi:MAG: hypothetical protein EZS28_042309 [Streblomastix strix]|uniref:Uncharacterized protein n=1 Tax=Streblomastix strix TaxID=222440 RepID=A0A5J4TXN8_9EUKA|nr:MAG: hypothetical protein EZS28_042309 [Streblomastix strix]